MEGEDEPLRICRFCESTKFPIRLRFPVADGKIIQNHFFCCKESLLSFITQNQDIPNSKDIIQEK